MKMGLILLFVLLFIIFMYSLCKMAHHADQEANLFWERYDRNRNEVL